MDGLWRRQTGFGDRLVSWNNRRGGRYNFGFLDRGNCRSFVDLFEQKQIRNEKQYRLRTVYDFRDGDIFLLGRKNNQLFVLTKNDTIKEMKQRGFSLIELMVAVGILILINTM